MRLIVFIITMATVFPCITSGQNSSYQPLQKGCVWNYHGVDSSYQNNISIGQWGWAVSNITHRIKILKDSVRDNDRDVKMYIYRRGGSALYGESFHWRLLNDTLYSGYEMSGHPDTSIGRNFFDYLGGRPGDTLLVQDVSKLFAKLDTLLILPNETVATPLGTFDCKVTEFRGRERFDWFEELNQWGGISRTYRAKNIGIVKKVTWYYNEYKKLSRVDFIIDSLYIPPTSRVTTPKNNFRLAQNKAIDNSNFSEKRFNLAGQQIAFTKPSNMQLVRVDGKKYVYMNSKKQTL